MKKQKFIRTGWRNYSKLGLRRKKKIVYRKAKGEDNKIRLKIKGHLRNVSIGFRSPKKQRGLIKDKHPKLIHNLQELKELKKHEIGIVANIGNKKRLEIAKYALEKKIELENLNPKKFIKELDFKIKKKKKLNEIKQKKKAERDKIAKKHAEEKEKEDKKTKEEKENKTNENLKNDKTKTNKKVEENTEIKKSLDKTIDKKTEKKKEIQTNNYGRGK